MSQPFEPTLTPRGTEQVYLEAMRFGVTEQLSDFAASRMDYQLLRQFDPPGLAHRLSVEILTRATSPRVYTDRRSASIQLVRFASWWDHYKATYRRRWWMSWRRWQINYTVREAVAVAEVKVEATMAAVFPHAEDPPDRLGAAYPVVWGRRIP